MNFGCQNGINNDEFRAGATLELGGGHGPPNFFNSPLELVKKNYKLLKLHVNLFTAPPNFRIDSLKI